MSHMEKYGLELAGVNVCLSTDQELTITDRLTPFLVNGEMLEPDCFIEITSCELFPPIPKEGERRGPAYHVYCGEEQWIFHYKDATDKPYAWVRMLPSGDIQVRYLPEYASFFTGTAGLFNRIGAENLFLQYQRLILHAAFVKDKEKAILFSGPSGIGKSTQAELWRQHKKAEIVNGDKVAIGQVNDVWTAWGIPYAGTSRIYRRESAPIEAIVILQQAKINRIQKLVASKAAARLYPEFTMHTWDEIYVDKVLEILRKIVTEVPVYLMECLPDESAVTYLNDFLEKERTT